MYRFRSWRCVLVVFLSALAARGAKGGEVRKDAGRERSCLVPVDPRIEYAHFVNFRPGDGQDCTLNPPRFSWGYDPGVVPKTRAFRPVTFRLQLSKTRDFSRPDIEVRDTPYNFYNALPVLDAKATWRWRVGYRFADGGEVRWSRVRTFTISGEAVEWDRTVIREVGRYLTGHPRVPFSADEWEIVRRLDRRRPGTDPLAAEIRNGLLAGAQKVLKAKWWSEFPEDDRHRFGGGKTKFEGGKRYARIGCDLGRVALAYKLTGAAEFAGVKKRMLKMASWGPGGYSAPEGMPKADAKNTTQLSTILGLYFDWFYHELSEAERRILIDSLRWRIGHTIDNYAWKRKGVASLRGVAGFTASHPYQNFGWTVPGAVATYEHLEESRRAVELGLHYFTGVTNSFGPEEAWNEGMSYGGWKLTTTLDCALYLHFAFPQLHMERNPYWQKIGDFFARLSPLGVQHCSFGNYGNSMNYVRAHNANFRKLAFLTGDGRLFGNWQECHTWEGRNRGFATPDLDLAITYHRKRLPRPSVEKVTSRLFPVSGWVMAGSHSPSDAAAYKDAVGIIYHCRPRGGYSHSFFSENAFDLYAYGEVIANGGGGTENGNPFSRSTMSHNSILIDGVGQSQNKMDPGFPWAGRVIAFRRARDHVYWAGDATRAYQGVPNLRRAIRHVVFVRNRYFVIFDDLAVDQAKPARFSWLYHVRQKTPVEISGAGFRYKIGDVSVRVEHFARPDDLETRNQRGLAAYRNLITGEDMKDEVLKRISKTGSRIRARPEDIKLRYTFNNVWVTNRTPAAEHVFLAVIIPWRTGQGEPAVERLSDRRVRVRFARLAPETISFGRGRRGDTISIDADEIREGARALEKAYLAGPASVRGPDRGEEKVLFEENFDACADGAVPEGWWVEGSQEVFVEEGRLRINANPEKGRGDGRIKGVCTVWNKLVISGDVKITYDAQVVDSRIEANNLNFFLFYSDPSGRPLFETRESRASGSYKLYHGLEGYIFTYLNDFRGEGGRYPDGSTKGRFRMRRCPGFNLIDETYGYHCRRGVTYRVAITRKGGTLTYAVDGEEYMRAEDDRPLEEGLFGLRTYATDFWVDNFKVVALE